MMVTDFSQRKKTWHIILLQARDQWVIVFAWSFFACVQTSPISFVARGNRRRLHAGKVLLSFRLKIFFDLLAIIWIVEWWDNIEIPDCPGFF